MLLPDSIRQAAIIVISLSFLVIGFTGCAGCSSRDDKTAVTTIETSHIDFIDSTGTPVTLHGYPQRIVCLNMDAAEVLAAIGAGDRVVGVSESLLSDPGMAGRFPYARPLNGSWNTLNIESILELKPDLVITISSTGPNLDSLEQAGIPVVHLDCYIIDRLPREVEILGRITGHETGAAQYLAWYNDTADLVNSRLSGRAREDWPTIYCEGGSDYSAYGNGSGADAIIGMAHGNNLAHSINTAWIRVSPEWVVQQDPEILLRVAYASNLQNQTYQQIAESQSNRSSISNIRAIRNGRVYIINNRSMYGPRGLLTLLYLSKVFYPDTFADIDLTQKFNTYCKTFGCMEDTNQHYYPAINSMNPV